MEDGPLKTATAIVGLLTGVVALVYILGGTVIALRLLFDHYSLDSVRLVLGQLPRELVITTAMLSVVGPAVLVGLFSTLVHGARGRPKARTSDSDELTDGPHAWRFFAYILFWAVLFALPAAWQTFDSEGTSALLIVPAFVLAISYGVIASGWYLGRRLGRKDWSRLVKAIAAGGIWAVYALIPAAVLASVLSFEDAQVCTSASQVPEGGVLIGEGGGRVLLGQQLGHEAGVVSLPSDQVTKTEYGDLSSAFTCPSPPGAATVAKVALEALGGHASAAERRLATALRPSIRFDSHEPWRPIEVEAFLAERFEDDRGHGACARGADPPCPTVEGLAQLRPGADGPAYVDIYGEKANGTDFASPAPGCLRSPPARDCNSGPPAVVYYRRTSHDGRWYWDYWWLLRYNDYNGNVNRCVFVCGDHEGDWEGITVITTPSLKPEILGAIYAAHGDRVFVDATVLPTSAGHPLVWVASGTHASYAFDCDRGCSQYGGLPEESHDGAVPWGGNRDAECEASRCVRPLPELGHSTDAALPFAGRWAAWPGRWGETCHNGCRSPLSHRESSPASPGRQPRFECPWVPNRRARPAADGLSEAPKTGDFERLMAACRAQRGGV